MMEQYKNRADKVRITAKTMRKLAIEMAWHAGKRGAHLGAGLSAIEILACLYADVMQLDLEHRASLDQDVFIPGKAHCVLAYYTALMQKGYFDRKKLDTFDNNLTQLSGHPVKNPQLGIAFSGGSLGMGLSQGVGMALGMKRKQISRYVYVLLGDGECQEGAVWEAVLSAVHFELDHLVLIIDKNGLQYDGPPEKIMGPADIAEVLNAYGCDTHVVPGHDVSALLHTFDHCHNHGKKPHAIVAETIKGKGVSFMEGQPSFHHAVLTKEMYEEAIAELESTTWK